MTKKKPAPVANSSGETRQTLALTVAPADEALAASGPKALQQIQSRLDALKSDEVQPPRLVLEKALLAALGVARRAHDERFGPLFAAIAGSLLDPAHVAGLETLVWATWHTARQYQAASAGSSEAALPASLVTQASEVETRMQRCVEYHLASHPVAGSAVTFLRPGSGHRDLANDLLGYADLYRTYRSEVEDDRRYYRATDEHEADTLATRILSLLAAGNTDEARRWLALQNRAWTLLERSYNEVAATGRWLARANPTEAAELFPSLYAVARSSTLRSPDALPVPPTPTPG